MKIKTLSMVIAMAVSTGAFADIKYKIEDTRTSINLSGFLNGGYYGNNGDYAKWDNIDARYRAKRNLDSILNSDVASDSDKENAQEQYDAILKSNPYWQSRKTSKDDVYFRATLDVEQEVNDSLAAFGFYERDFYSNGSSDDDVRDAYVGIKTQYGNLRFGRDENSLTYVREMLYTPEEKSGYELQSFIEPRTISGRNNNSVIYSYNQSLMDFEAGYIIGSEENFKKNSGYSFSSKFKFLPFSISVGYAFGEDKMDKEGVYNQPDLTYFGYTPFEISQQFNGVTDDLSYAEKEKQLNIGVSYSSNLFETAFIYMKSRNDLDVNGTELSGNNKSNLLSYDTQGYQYSILKNFNDKYQASFNYSYLENTNNDFNIINAMTIEGKYFIFNDSFIFVNVGSDNSDYSEAYAINSGMRLVF